MKMLVCVDGSEHSRRSVEEAVKIAAGCNFKDVTIIHVCERKYDWGSISEEGPISRKDLENIQNFVHQCDYDRNQKTLLDAKQVFASNGIEAETIFKEGHPAQTIIKEANEEGYDIVVIGSRGLGGLQKLILGSVSNAVIQEVKANVYVVK